MPTVFIWRPGASNKYGHAAVKTYKYHMSFWPNGRIKEDLSAVEALVGGVKAALVLHHDYDRYLESARDPIQYQLRNVTDEALNRVYEGFLDYNNIAHDRASLEWANRAIERQLRPDVELPTTEYTFAPELISNKRPSWRVSNEHPFYRHPQSCVSFCYHLIEMADPSGGMTLRPQRDLQGGTSGDTYTVPFFEDVVSKHYLQPAKDDDSCCIG